MPECPIHAIIKTQTFSVEEAEQFIRQAEFLKICTSYVYSLSRIIDRATNAAILSDRSLRDGNARQDQAVTTGNTVPMRKRKPR
jgi:flagella basal body P-ring formation protein FlgA